ncbi:hypothetical protein GCM10010389_07910 [Streptomyces echinoruber]|uniref:Uncharacterized protein n=1 Tax=Streptomyces echinoruber TaxID=68898 RepID=A0A918QYG1_9ACTN|nr:hypothetical protein GCM10010389_07910 [Streptomyces echinoruber]
MQGPAGPPGAEALLCPPGGPGPPQAPQGAQRARPGAAADPVPRTPDEPCEAAPAPFQPPKPDPLAPLRICGCGREFRDRAPAARCPDCLYAEHAEAARLRQFGT